MTIIYTALAIILDDKGRPIRAGDSVIITLNDTTTVIGVMQAPFNPDDLKYTFALPEGVEIDICQIVSIVFYTCCDALQEELDALTEEVASNTADIATNTADIATNTAGIATNTADIATNTADIATNTAQILVNSNNITNSLLLITTNAQNHTDFYAQFLQLLPQIGYQIDGGGNVIPL